MIHRIRGDMLAQEADALVNTVNCVGAMGRGIALQFRRAFGDNYEAYLRAVRLGEVVPGRMFVYERPGFDSPRYIINFPTKRHWKGKSRLEDIESGLVDLVRVIRGNRIGSIAIPPLGCGLGGLDWGVVRPLIERALAGVPGVEVYLFEPGRAPAAAAMVNRTRRPKLTDAKAALLSLVESYLVGLMDFEVTLLEIHKLMYFLERAGEPLKLQYSKGPYGPYTKKLSYLIESMEGHFLLGYGEGGDDPFKPIELLGGASLLARATLLGRPATLDRLGEVGRLIEGFESPYGMELLATVDWVADREGARSLGEAVAKIHAWNPRKAMFTPHQIEAAWDRLCRLGWLGDGPAEGKALCDTPPK